MGFRPSDPPANRYNTVSCHWSIPAAGGLSLKTVPNPVGGAIGCTAPDRRPIKRTGSVHDQSGCGAGAVVVAISEVIREIMQHGLLPSVGFRGGRRQLEHNTI